eukprot:TRINITY_DN712_c0_g1_i1.p1 TRINITY_DN712_c0_g1~~TRINITY_DN712_c0_g1_i1.p1  ORF type:complete len:241 (+),score=62.06 TRINITY_DN712_c0_g1_i1:66-788(+)
MPNKKGFAGKPKNELLAKGIPRYSRSAMYRRTGRVYMKKNNKTYKNVEAPKKADNVQKHTKYYPGEKVHHKKAGPNPKAKRHTHLRASLTPGTILILLAGRFRGKRVVFLKQLESGLLLVTGPHQINGIPLRRVNQAYVIATSTKVNITGIDLSAFKDEQFRAPKQSRAAQLKERKGFADKKDAAAQPFQLTDAQKAQRVNQDNFDKQLLALISETPLLKQYLQSNFTLHKGQYPHELKF